MKFFTCTNKYIPYFKVKKTQLWKKLLYISVDNIFALQSN